MMSLSNDGGSKSIIFFSFAILKRKNENKVGNDGGNNWLSGRVQLNIENSAKIFFSVFIFVVF